MGMFKHSLSVQQKRNLKYQYLQLLIQNHAKKKQQHDVSHCYRNSTKESPLVYLLCISIHLDKLCRLEQSMQHIPKSRMSLHGLRFHKNWWVGLIACLVVVNKAVAIITIILIIILIRACFSWSITKPGKTVTSSGGYTASIMHAMPKTR